MGNSQDDLQEWVLTEIEEELEEPPLYKVLLHNDDYTSREFVVGVLMAFFDMSADDAARLMWFVHRNGVGECGTFPYEVAETKVYLVTDAARENGFPLKATLEPQ